MERRGDRIMEMDCWQYWEVVEADAKEGKVGMSCEKGHEVDAYERAKSGNAFRPCPECGAEVRFYRRRH